MEKSYRVIKYHVVIVHEHARIRFWQVRVLVLAPILAQAKSSSTHSACALELCNGPKWQRTCVFFLYWLLCNLQVFSSITSRRFSNIIVSLAQKNQNRNFSGSVKTHKCQAEKYVHETVSFTVNSSSERYGLQSAFYISSPLEMASLMHPKIKWKKRVQNYEREHTKRQRQFRTIWWLLVFYWFGICRI